MSFLLETRSVALSLMDDANIISIATHILSEFESQLVARAVTMVRDRCEARHTEELVKVSGIH